MASGVKSLFHPEGYHPTVSTCFWFFLSIPWVSPVTSVGNSANTKMCLSYFICAVIKSLMRSNLRETGFIWLSVWGDPVHHGEKDMAGGTRGRSPYICTLEAESGQEEWSDDKTPESLIVSDQLPPLRFHLLKVPTFQNSCQLSTSIQHWGPWREFFAQAHMLSLDV